MNEPKDQATGTPSACHCSASFRLDCCGRDVTGLPGLWSESDIKWERPMADMTIAEEIYDSMLDANRENPFCVDSINDILERRLYRLLCEADGMLSAIRHGRKVEDSELEQVYYPLRDAAESMRTKSKYLTIRESRRVEPFEVFEEFKYAERQSSPRNGRTQ